MRRRTWPARAAAAATAAAARPAVGAPPRRHPLGNFTVSHYDGAAPAPDRVDVTSRRRHRRDPVRAAARRTSTSTATTTLSAAGAPATRRAPVRRRVSTATAAVDGAPVALTAGGAARSCPRRGRPGHPPHDLRAAPPTPTSSGPATVEFEDGFRADRIGWREVIAAGDGLRIVASDGPGRARSATSCAPTPTTCCPRPLDVRSAAGVGGAGRRHVGRRREAALPFRCRPAEPGCSPQGTVRSATSSAASRPSGSGCSPCSSPSCSVQVTRCCPGTARP